jgi:ribosome biogenesis GTPase
VTAPAARGPEEKPAHTLQVLGWDAPRDEEFSPYAREGLVPGRVVGEHRTHHQVATSVGELSASLAGRLRKSDREDLALPGVGDFVAVRPTASDGPAVIEAVLERRTALIRKASGEPHPQLLASNVDVVLVVMALDNDFSVPRLERYLALIAASGAKPVLVANKVDKAVDAPAMLEQLSTAAPGVPIHAMTAKNADEARALLSYASGNRTLALIGSSGVGKSTLTNQLLGRTAQLTQKVRSHDNRGRHTTTHRQLFLLPGGGSIMDTPGMRGLEAWTAEPDADAGLTAIEELALECRFRNCGHTTEPGCAVRAAVERGEIDPEAVARLAAKRAAAVPRWAR